MPFRPAALLALLAVAACASPDAPPQTAAPTTSRVPPPEPSELSVETDSLVERGTPGLVVTVAYPQVAGVAGAAAPNALDAANRGMRDSVEAFVRTVAPTEPPGAFDVAPVFETAGGFETTLFEADLYSGVVSVVSYSGGAHPNAFSLGLTRDLRTGAPVALADLFRPGAPILDTLSAHVARGVVRQLTERGGMAPDEAREAIAAYNPDGVRLPGVVWALTPGGLRLFVPPYAVMAYAAGSFEIDVPFETLGDMLAGSVPVARFRAGTAGGRP